MKAGFKTISRIVLFAAVVLPIFANAYYNPAAPAGGQGTPTGFVNDYTGTLSPADKQALEVKLSDFEKQSSNEISVVIIPSLQGDTIENFAVQLFKDWGIGKKQHDNGVLLLIAKDDHKMRIEVGYGLEGALTDIQSAAIISNDLTPAFRANDFAGGINRAVGDIMAATRGEYQPTAPAASSKKGGGVDVETIIWGGLFVFVWLASILGRSKSWWAGGVVGGLAGVVIGLVKGFLFFGIAAIGALVPLGLLFDYVVSKKYSAAKESGARVPWWIGGGRGGGGSGGFGGGGFGGFGGGSSGGGGASGSW